jgi:hypothetical protein
LSFPGSAAMVRRRKSIILRATPYQRLLADTRISEEVRRQVTTTYVTLDPVRLLQTIVARKENWSASPTVRP